MGELLLKIIILAILYVISLTFQDMKMPFENHQSLVDFWPQNFVIIGSAGSADQG